MRVARLLIALTLVAMAVLGLAGTASAAGPAGTWVSGIQVQNQHTTNAANITISFYWGADAPAPYTPGALAIPAFTDVIPAKESKTYYVPNAFPSLPENFVGSAVVSADQPVAAILNTTKLAAGSDLDPKRMGSAVGVLDPATKVYTPYLRKAYYYRNSYIAVQNTSAGPANVTVTYKDYTTGATIAAATQSATIPAYTSKIFYQNDNAGLPDMFRGGAVIESAAPLAVVVNNANLGTAVASAGFESYNGLSTGATKVYLPKQTVNYSGYQSSFTAQNVGTVAATMTAVFTFGATTFTKVSPVIQPGGSWGPYLATEADSGITTGFSGSGSAIITCAQPIVAVAAEVNSAKGYSVIWNAVPDGSGTSAVLYPKFDRNYSNYNGGIQVQNVGTLPTTLSLVFSQSGLPDVTYNPPDTLQPGGAPWFVFSTSVPGLSDGFHGSVVVTSISGQPIAGIYTSRNATLSGDSYVAYNGIQK